MEYQAFRVGAVAKEGGPADATDDTGRRGSKTGTGLLEPAGGLVELGETMAAAICRELAEKTGISVRLLGIAAVLERIFPDPDGRIAYHYVLADFLPGR